MKDKWICPNCKNFIILHVRPSEPPVCNNQKTHTSSKYKMVRSANVAAAN